MSKVIYTYDSAVGKVVVSAATERPHQQVYEHDASIGKVKRTDR